MVIKMNPENTNHNDRADDYTAENAYLAALHSQRRYRQNLRQALQTNRSDINTSSEAQPRKRQRKS